MAETNPAQWTSERLRAPHAYLCDDDDYLRISVLGGGTQRVRVTGRVVDFDGCIKDFNHEVTAPASRTIPSTMIVRVGRGYLLNVTCVSLSAVTGLAQMMVTVDLVRGPGAGGGVTATLLQGPVSSLQRIAWPGSLLLTSLDVAGILRSIAGTDQAAGAEISETVPAGARWRLRALSAVLVTDGNAANREVTITIDDGTTILFTAPSGFTHTASLTKRYSAAMIGAQTTPAQTTDRQIILPDLWLPGGARIKTVTTNIQVGDNYGAPQLLVEETLEGL
jgi:hypothetical protein